MKKLLTLFFLTLCVNTAIDQQNRLERYNHNGWYFLPADSIRITLAALISDYKADLGLTQYDSLGLYTTQADSGTGNVHYRYKQYYKSYEVENSQLIVHTVNGNVELFTDALIKGLNMSVANPVSEASARTLALADVGAQEYWWQNANAIQAYRESKDDSTAIMPVSRRPAAYFTPVRRCICSWQLCICLALSYNCY